MVVKMLNSLQDSGRGLRRGNGAEGGLGLFAISIARPYHGFKLVQGGRILRDTGLASERDLLRGGLVVVEQEELHVLLPVLHPQAGVGVKRLPILDHFVGGVLHSLGKGLAHLGQLVIGIQQALETPWLVRALALFHG